MDGFNSIPIDNNAWKSTSDNSSLSGASQNTKDLVGNTDKDIEITDETKKENKKNPLAFLFPLSILCFLGVLLYFFYLVFLRWSTLQKVAILSEDFTALSRNINKDEIEDFIILDKSLKSISQKLSEHNHVSEVLDTVNRNIRTNIQVSDYRLETKGNEVSVGLTVVAPSFRELAEQTEKLSELKSSGQIKGFTVQQMALESDGRRVRFVLNIVFEKRSVLMTSAAVPEQTATESINNNQEN